MPSERWADVDALNFDRVLPAIAEVIEVCELAYSAIFEDVGKPSLAGIEGLADAPICIRVRRAPSDVAGAQLVEM
jgi:hypothetical protein